MPRINLEDIADLLDAAPGPPAEERQLPVATILAGKAAPVPVEIFSVRDLEEEDLLEMEVSRSESRKSPSPPAVRRNHHEIARMSVLGFKNKEIAEVVQMTQATISRLLGSPGMRQLIAYYQEQRDAATVADPLARMKLTAYKGLGRLQDALDDPETPLPLVHKITADMLDRTGHPAVQKAEVHNSGGLSDDELNAIKQAARQANSKTIEGGAVGGTPAGSPPSEGGAPRLGGAGQDL